MSSPEVDRHEFDEIMQRQFAFLGAAGLQARGTRKLGSQGRDSGYVSRFESPVLRIEIGWSSFERSLAVLLKHNISEIPEGQRYTYFEPLIEFLSEGREAAIVPYVTERMSASRIEKVMEERQVVFAKGLEPVVQKLASKLSAHLSNIQAVSVDQIAGYHNWIGAIR